MTGKFGNTIEVYSMLPYRVGDQVTNNTTPSTKHALHFDGTDDYISIGDAHDFPIDNVFTVECWFNFENSSNNAPGLITNLNFSPNRDGWGLEIDKANLKIEFSRYLDDTSNTALTTITSNNKYHVAGVYDGIDIKIYMNSILKNTVLSDLLITASTGDLKFAVLSEDYFGGIIDDVRIWNVARSQEQIQANLYTEFTGSESNLVGYWNFNTGIGNVAIDSTSSGNDGNINGASWINALVNRDTFNIISIRNNSLILDSEDFIFEVGDNIYIINEEADADSYATDKFRINSLDSLNNQVAVFSLTNWLQYFKLKLPKRRFYKNTCPWIYKGEECHYPDDGTGDLPNTIKTANGFFDINNDTVFIASDDVCSKNSLACELRNNEVHFGGFGGTGRTGPRQ